MVLEPFYVLKKRVRLEQIVVIEKTDPLAFRHFQTTIRRG